MCDEQQFSIRVGDSNARQLHLGAFPELAIVYLRSENNLCASRFGVKLMCFWEGDLNVTLEVDGKEIIVNDHDQKNSVSQTIQTDDYSYVFQGIEAIVERQSREHTYLLFSVRRCPIQSAKKNTGNQKTYGHALGDPFTVILAENVTTGYAWQVEHSKGLEILSDVRVNDCDTKKVGCGGYRIWTLRGIVRGPQQFTARSVRPWEKNKDAKPEVFSFRII